MSATTTPYLSLPSFRPRLQNPAKTTHQLSPPLSWSVSKRKKILSSSDRQLWRLCAATPEEIVSSDTSSSSEAIVSGGGQDGVALIIQVLLIVAFLALSVLTIGVVYIGVTEFLGKRERDKFEKEEAAKKSKKSGKKKAATRARAGPRGFGQKIDDDDIDLE
ncbi:hypothetical protein Bca4012_053214 [Brassica carinata]|uniref:Uncharacterized protein n=2 Tax=Brassica TaxID=3705 RepID=A0A8X7RAN0_BRACI|nr:hypothetical protein Bca52824_055762 [Brassica carinata]CAF1921922.1 unnamed protein product [Brassica napus]CDY33996.1 BnaC02g43410D [Brassica napus]